MEKRRNGITFQFGKTFTVGEHAIPQKELYELAAEENCTELLKTSLAYKWLRKHGVMVTVLIAANSSTTKGSDAT